MTLARTEYQLKPYMTEIIIVRYKLPKIENECIKSVLDYTSNYHLTVYDNERENINLGRLWNSLIRRSDADKVCLLNTDTLVENSWLITLEKLLDSSSNIGAVGPVTNSAKNSQKQQKGSGSFDLPKEEMLSGFCLLFPKKIWEEVGGFPEDCGFYGQETAMMKKFQVKGYRQVVSKDVFVFHYGSASAIEAEKRGEMNIPREREEGRTYYQKFRDIWS